MPGRRAARSGSRPEEELTVRQAADLLGLSWSRVNRILRDRDPRLPYRWQGGIRKLRRIDVEAFDKLDRPPGKPRPVCVGRIEAEISGAEAGRRLGVTRERVYELIQKGRLSARREGRSLFVPVAEVESFSRRPNVGRPQLPLDKTC